jgi:hypothetical protein
MNNEKVITEEQAHTNPMLSMRITGDNKLKEILVEYVGTKLDQEEVTVNMIAEVLAADFPEFAFAYAEENYLRGYQQGLDDAQGLHRKLPEAD